MYFESTLSSRKWLAKTNLIWNQDLKLPKESTSWSMKELKRLCKPILNLMLCFHHESFETLRNAGETIVTPAMLWHSFPLPLIDDMEKILLYYEVSHAHLQPMIFSIYERAKFLEETTYKNFS